MTVSLILLASFGTSFLAWPGKGSFGEWFDKEGIGWFVLAFFLWFAVAETMGLPMGISESD